MHSDRIVLFTDYRICGEPERGYKVYRESGVYFAYPEVTKVDVICIGGGGGGYDITNSKITELGRAGDGGNSSFGSHLTSGEGYGGSKASGNHVTSILYSHYILFILVSLWETNHVSFFVTTSLV